MTDWEARALAAERTVEVLKRKVKELYNGGTSTIAYAIERAREREAELRKRQEVALVRNAELQRYSETLAAEVRMRTHDIRVILDNAVSGFLVVGPDGLVRDGYSRSCVTLLGRDALAGTAAIASLSLDERAGDMFSMQLQLLFDDVLPDEVVVAQFPQRTIGANGRALQIAGRVIRNEVGAIEAVLFTLTDITALEAAERENAHYRLLVSILRQRSAFTAFVSGVRVLARSGRDAAGAGNDNVARRAMHTIKGDAACFGLADIAHMAHVLEDERALAPAHFDAIESAIDRFLADESEVLGPIAAESATIEVSADQLATLRSCTSPSQIAAWITRIERRPMRIILAPIETLVRRLADRFAKSVDLVIEGGDRPVDFDLLSPVVRELGHLVRNAVDHGIEEAGIVKIRFTEDRDHYAIEVADNGRGIDVDHLRERAIQKGIVSEAALAGASRNQLLELVFAEGLSTADPTTEISGRGIGMAAVRGAVASVGGRIRIESERDRGTRIEILVPIPADTVRAMVA
jgi:two-component system chemotaxis sensor kinase CheA